MNIKAAMQLLKRNYNVFMIILITLNIQIYQLPCIWIVGIIITDAVKF